MNKIRQWLRRVKNRDAEAEVEEPQRRSNHYLPWIREILEQIMSQRGLSYGAMRPLVIDADGEDDVKPVLEKLSADLNYLTILTERPVYFEGYVETMYEENGLPAHVERKEEKRKFDANTVLDFEQRGSLCNLELAEPFIYLPIYKKSWETGENLDIFVPIGYNTVIVKGIKKEEGCYNRYGKEKYLDL